MTVGMMQNTSFSIPHKIPNPGIRAKTEPAPDLTCH
jgi:hypothetical protein